MKMPGMTIRFPQLKRIAIVVAMAIIVVLPHAAHALPSHSAPMPFVRVCLDGHPLELDAERSREVRAHRLDMRAKTNDALPRGTGRTYGKAKRGPRPRAFAGEPSRPPTL